MKTDDLIFTIEEEEDGDWIWRYGKGGNEYTIGKTINDVREDIVRYVKDHFGNNTKFYIRFQTDPKDWSL